jgi:hypothetical protein
MANNSLIQSYQINEIKRLTDGIMVMMKKYIFFCYPVFHLFCLYNFSMYSGHSLRILVQTAEKLVRQKSESRLL